MSDGYKVTFTTHAPKVKAELANRIPIILEALGLQAEGNAIDEANKLVYDQPESPNYVRTGRLKNSISHAHDDHNAYIGTNVEYAPYVELGTHKMASRPFLRNAISNYTDEYKKIIEDGLK